MACCGCLCSCQSGSVPLSITLSVPAASLLYSPGTSAIGAVGYDDLKDGGQCVNDTGVIDWLKSISIVLKRNGITTSWSGSGTFSSPWGPVVVNSVLTGACSGSLFYSLSYCPPGESNATCIASYGPDTGSVGGSGNLCQFTTARTATGFVAQRIAIQTTGFSPSCRSSAGGFVANRGFAVSLKFEPTPIP